MRLSFKPRITWHKDVSTKDGISAAPAIASTGAWWEGFGTDGFFSLLSSSSLKFGCVLLR